MKSPRKMVMVANQIKADEEDAADVAYWLSKSPAERLAEVSRLRRNYFTWTDGYFPKSIEKVVHQVKL